MNCRFLCQTNTWNLTLMTLPNHKLNVTNVIFIGYHQNFLKSFTEKNFDYSFLFLEKLMKFNLDNILAVVKNELNIWHFKNTSRPDVKVLIHFKNFLKEKKTQLSLSSLLLSMRTCRNTLFKSELYSLYKNELEMHRFLIFFQLLQWFQCKERFFILMKSSIMTFDIFLQFLITLYIDTDQIKIESIHYLYSIISDTNLAYTNTNLDLHYVEYMINIILYCYYISYINNPNHISLLELENFDENILTLFTRINKSPFNINLSVHIVKDYLHARIFQLKLPIRSIHYSKDYRKLGLLPKSLKRIFMAIIHDCTESIKPSSTGNSIKEQKSFMHTLISNKMSKKVNSLHLFKDQISRYTSNRNSSDSAIQKHVLKKTHAKSTVYFYFSIITKCKKIEKSLYWFQKYREWIELSNLDIYKDDLLGYHTNIYEKMFQLAYKYNKSLLFVQWLYSQFLLQNLHSSVSYEYIMKSFIRVKDYESVIEFYQLVLRSKKKKIENLTLTLKAYCHLGNVPEALEIFYNEFECLNIKKDKKRPMLWYDLMILVHKNNPKEITYYYNQMKFFYPDYESQYLYFSFTEQITSEMIQHTKIHKLYESEVICRRMDLFNDQITWNANGFTDFTHFDFNIKKYFRYNTFAQSEKITPTHTYLTDWCLFGTLNV